MNSPASFPSRGASVRPPRLDHETFLLDNGLTVVVQQDSRAPIVAINLWYGVGSKDEPVGRTGFAHLFEHLFFNGSENRREDWHFLLNELGGIDVNGSTSRDRTNYYQTVATGALDLVLWMEADRMGRLLPAIDAASLAREVMIVKNEKMQREAGPLGLLQEMEMQALYGAGHPYGHPVIGSMEDLDRVDVDAVASWYRAWYGPGNAVLTLVGDLTPEQGHAAAERAFGGVPAGNPVRRLTKATPLAPLANRASFEGRLPVAGLRRTWLTAPDGHDDAPLLQLAAAMLSAEGARLKARLVAKDRLVTDMNVRQLTQALSGEFSIGLQMPADAPLRAIEQAIDEEIGAFLENGPDEAELSRARRILLLGSANALRSLGARADCLSMGQTLHGRADEALDACRIVEEATASQVLEAARRWLTRPALSLEIAPFKGVTGPAALPTRRPSVPAPVMPTFPAIEERRLANGLTIVHARRPAEMSVDIGLVLDGGVASQPAGKTGVAELTLHLMARETRNRSRGAIVERCQEIGAHFQTSVATDVAALSMSVLADNWIGGLDLLFDIACRPSFPPGEFGRLLEAAVAARQSAQFRPGAIVDRALGQHMFGPGHPYADSATPESVAALTLADVATWYAGSVQPARATLFSAGDFDIDAIASVVEALTGDWHQAEHVAEATPTPIPFVPGDHRVSIQDAEQTIVLAALPVGPEVSDDAALHFVTTILGGDTSSRLFRRLREEKGWTYSVGTSLSEARAGRWLRFAFSVQADVTDEAIDELKRVIAETGTLSPITEAELGAAKSQVLRSLPSIWAENSAVLDTMVSYKSTGRPLSAIGSMPSRVAGVTLDQVRTVAGQILKSERLVLVAGEPQRADRTVAAASG
jgi:zinc protease